MSEGPLSQVKCTLHNQPITRIKKQKQLNLIERALCSKCQGEGSSIQEIYQILDKISTFIDPIHKIYNGLHQSLLNLKLEIGRMMNQIFSFIEITIQQSEFEITKLQKYLKYQDYYKEFKIEDLQRLVDFVYNDNILQSPIYQCTQQLNKIQSAYKNQLIQLFEDIIKLIKGDTEQYGQQNNYQDQKLKENQDQTIQFQLPQNTKQNKRPILQEKSTIFTNKSIRFTKKNEFKIGLVFSTIFNQKGDMFIYGQYPFHSFKNIEIKSIDDNSNIKEQYFQDVQGENANEEVTALALDEITTQLFVGYRSGDISTYQYSANTWKKKAQQNAFSNSVNFLILNSSNTELFSSGDKTIKIFNCSQKIVACKKVKMFNEEIDDFQINKEFDYLFLIIAGKLDIYINSDELPELQQISLQKEEKVTVIATESRKIYLGSNQGNIHIFQQQQIGNKYIFASFTKILEQQTILQLKYCKETQLLLFRFEKKVIIYQIDLNNKFECLQEISGYFNVSDLHSNKKISQIILFSEYDSKASHYISERVFC